MLRDLSKLMLVLVLPLALTGCPVGVEIVADGEFARTETDITDDTPTAEATKKDTKAPLPGAKGALVVSDVSFGGAEVSWTPAKDDVTDTSDLTYLVYVAERKIPYLSDILAYGTPYGKLGLNKKGYVAGLKKKSLSGLKVATDYWVNVVVQDKAGNKAAYTQGTFHTSIELSHQKLHTGEQAFSDLGGGSAGKTYIEVLNDYHVLYTMDKSTNGSFNYHITGIDAKGDRQLLDIKHGGTVKHERSVLSADKSKYLTLADADTDDVYELYITDLSYGTTTTKKINTTLPAGGNIAVSTAYGRYMFSFSPDSKKVVYGGDQDTDDVFELYSANTDGTGRIKVTNNDLFGLGALYTYSYAFTDDGKVIYGNKNDSKFYSVDMTTGQKQAISTGTFTDVTTMFASGKFFYYVDKISSRSQLFRINLETGAQTQLTSFTAGTGVVTIYPPEATDTYVTYWANETATSAYRRLHSLNLETGSLSDITSGANSILTISNERIFGDNRLAIANENGTKKLWLFTPSARFSVEDPTHASATITTGVIECGGYVYFQAYTALASANHIHRVKMDGTGLAIAKDMSATSISSRGPMLCVDSQQAIVSRVRIDSADYFRLIKHDGSGETQLGPSLTNVDPTYEYDYKIIGERLYFIAQRTTDTASNVYSIKLDGTGLLRHNSSALAVAGDHIENMKITEDGKNLIYVHHDSSTTPINERAYTIGLTKGFTP